MVTLSGFSIKVHISTRFGFLATAAEFSILSTSKSNFPGSDRMRGLKAKNKG